MEKINYQIMEKSNDGNYYPDYEKLIAGATSKEEAEYIASVKEKAKKMKFGFAWNMVYVTRYTCGHYEIFQTPQNEHYPLAEVLRHAAEYVKTRQCSSCIRKR